MPGANSPSPFEGGLSGSFSDHPRSNEWASNGQTLPAWEATVLESSAMGDSRHQAATTSPSWDSTTLVNTGMTRGGPDAQYNSSLPNH